MRKLFIYATAMAVSITVSAQNVSTVQQQSFVIGGGAANIAEVSQSGNNNTAEIDQRYLFFFSLKANEATIDQGGAGNHGHILQVGVGNIANIFQRGTENNAKMEVWGINNNTEIIQGFEASYASDVSIQGDASQHVYAYGSRALIDQVGRQNVAVQQIGDWGAMAGQSNSFSIYQLGVNSLSKQTFINPTNLFGLGHSNTAHIYQNSSESLAEQIIGSSSTVSNRNYAEIVQSNEFVNAFQQILGSDNRTYTSQYTPYDRSTQVVIGNGNYTSIGQSGEFQITGSDNYNLARVIMTGDNNEAFINQYGAGDWAEQTIIGDNNDLGTVQQWGSGNFSVDNINGNYNTTFMWQQGIRNINLTNITGNYNEIALEQDGSNNENYIDITGSNNSATVSQSSWYGSNSAIIQSGNGNVAIVGQQ